MDCNKMIYELIEGNEIDGKELDVFTKQPSVFLRDDNEVLCTFGKWFELKEDFISACNKDIVRVHNGRIIMIEDIKKCKYTSSFKYKKIECIVRLPKWQDRIYGVENIQNCKIDDQDLVREYLETEIFGLPNASLTRLLNRIGLQMYGENMDIRSHFPRITYSFRQDNKCMITGLLIPKRFPYITVYDPFDEFKYISLWGFYLFMKTELKIGYISHMKEFWQQEQKIYTNLTSLCDDLFLSEMIYYDEYTRDA